MSSKIALTIFVLTAGACLFGILRRLSRAVPSQTDSELSRRVVRITGPIDDASANDVIAKLLYLQNASATEPIRLRVDSPGGAVIAGLAIIDTIEMLEAPVYTHCDGFAGSMALVVVTCGYRGHRSAGADSVMAFAMPEASIGATDEQMANGDRLATILIERVSKASSLPVAVVRRLFEDGTPIMAHQAVQLGLVDGTTSSKE